MIQKDYIQRMIDALSKVLGQIMGLKPPKGLELIQEAYQQHLRLEGDILEGLSKDELLKFLLEKKELNIHQIEFLGELMAKEGALHLALEESEKGVSKLQNALHLLEYVNLHSGLFSFERQQVIGEIKNQLRIV